MSVKVATLWLLAGLVPGTAQSAAPVTLSPREVLQRFDSLMDAGVAEQAKALCVGSALRMFPFLVEAQQKLAPFVDTALSRDTVIEEKQGEAWCVLKAVSDAVFRKRLMGMDRIHMVQAVHLYRQPDGWKLAEFEELSDEKKPLVLRKGKPAGEKIQGMAPLFPVSRMAPASRATRMQLKLSLRNGDSLREFPQGSGQKILRREQGSVLIQTSLPLIAPDEDRKGNGDSLKPYLATSTYLDLTDSMLLSKAGELQKGAMDGLDRVRRVYRFVSTSFHFKLGAALFSNSREALRNLEGDCSEAAVLTAALLRASGVPSRVVLGFATLERGVFIGHAWAEAFLGGQWIGVDPALREFPTGAQRVMLKRLSGSEDMRVEASNLMLQALSNLDIEITEAWTGDKKLPLIEQHGNAEEGRRFFEDVLKGVGE